jgi:hypothetical protein
MTMPAPSAAEIENLASSAVKSAGLEGEDAPRLAQAMADVFSQMLTMFASQTQVLPGIPAAVDPISTSGSTVGPGMLLPPPAGGPNASAIEGLAMAALQGAGLRGENIPDLAKALGQAGELGLTLFAAQAMVAPGIAIAGFVTTAPGRLM